MKTVGKYNVLCVALVLAFSALFLNSCGSSGNDPISGAKNTCNGGVWASDSDALLGGGLATLSIGAVFSGAPDGIIYSPFTFIVNDKDGHARNNVCVNFYTDGFFWTDENYAQLVPGTGPLQHIVGRTDVNGIIKLYWTTEPLPPSNPAVGTTAGENITSESWINADSGTQSANFTLTWTVVGEPAPTP